MADGMRLILAASKQEMVDGMKTGFTKKPYIESIITVARLSDAENKLTRKGSNILVWDLDDHRPDAFWAKTLQSKFSLYIIYTSFSNSYSNLVVLSGNDEYFQKPPLFTEATTIRYISNLEKYVDNLAKKQRPPAMRELVKMVGPNDKQKIIAVASSTGGTNALEDIIKRLPDDMPPMVVVQHMPSGFTKLFADRLTNHFRQDIREAQSGDYLMRGRILLAPADRHMILTRIQGKLAVECYEGERIHGVMPAADILFESVAKVMGSNAVGVVLTGMGNDGAKGLVHMKNAGCKTIGQDEASCVVYGMPRAAKMLGAIDHELPLSQIPEAMLRLAL